MTEMFKVNVGSARIVGEHAGKGEALVLLHAGIADRRMWHPQTAGLSDRYHVVAYDRRGFGKTTTDDEAFSNVEDLRVVLDQSGLSKVSLIGCSQGGRIAIDFTLKYPQRVTKLVLLAPAVSGAPRPESFPVSVQALLEKLDKAEESKDWAQVNQIETHLWLDGPTSPEGRVSGELRELVLDMNHIALNKPELTGEIEPPSAYERVSELTLPTLVISGELDFTYIKERCRYLIDTIPNAGGEEIPGTAHLPNLEQPETINGLLRAFLSYP